MLRFGWSSSITAIAAFVCALAFPVGADADTITLAWDRSPDSSVVGYMVYAEGPSGYSRSFDAEIASFLLQRGGSRPAILLLSRLICGRSQSRSALVASVRLQQYAARPRCN